MVKVGYVGLGAMGGSLARHLVKDHEVVVYDLNPNALATFRDLGAKVAQSLSDLARMSDIVVLCLPRSSDVEQALFGSDGMAEALRSGQVVIDQTSGEPIQTIEFARRLEEQGILFMDAPLSGGIPAAQKGSVLIMASGSDAAWNAGEAVLRGMSNKVLRCGMRVGDGQALKLLTNGIGACYRLATLELAALWRKCDLPLKDLMPSLNGGEGANFTSRNMMVGMVEGRSTTNFAMALMVKDLNAAVDLGTQTKQSMPLVATARGIMQSGIGLFGKDARLDDVIPLTEKLSAVVFVSEAEAASPNTPEGVSVSELADLLGLAATACNAAAVLEGVNVGRKFGLSLDEMARVIDTGSAWCQTAKPLFASLARGESQSDRYAAARSALDRVTQLAATVGLPFIMPALCRSRWRDIAEGMVAGGAQSSRETV